MPRPSSRRFSQQLLRHHGLSQRLTAAGWCLALFVPLTLALGFLPGLYSAWPLSLVSGLLLLCARWELGRSSAPSPPVWLLPETIRAGDVAVLGLRLGQRARPLHIYAPGRFGWRLLSVLQAGAGPGQRLLWRERFPQRGEQPLVPVLATWHDGLGLWARGQPWAPKNSVLVLPRSGRLQERFAARLAALYERGQALHLNGDDEPLRLRAFQHGDAPRHVHWPSSARAGELLVMQRAQVGNQTLTVWLDPVGPSVEVERLIHLAAVLVDHAERRHYRLHLCASCGLPELPCGSAARVCLEALARLAILSQAPEPALPKDPALIVLSQRLPRSAAAVVLRAHDVERCLLQPEGEH